MACPNKFRKTTGGHKRKRKIEAAWSGRKDEKITCWKGSRKTKEAKARQRHTYGNN